MVQVLPQVRVFQEFELLPTTIQQQLTAFIIGPHYNVRTYEKAKSQIGVGQYDSENDTIYSYPGRQAGEVVDQDFVRLFMDDALIKYFEQEAGVGGNPTVTAVDDTHIELSGLTGWAAAGNFSRYPTLVKDVEVGDRVKVTNPNDLGDTLVSDVRALVRETLASTIGAVSADSDNQATSGSSASSITSTPDTPPEDVVFAIDESLYDGSVDGIHTDAYTVSITKSGEFGVAEVTIISASGQDDVFDQVVNDGTAIVTGRGMRFTFTAGTDSSSSQSDSIPGNRFQAGQVWGVDVTASLFTAPADPVSSGTYTGPTDTTYVVEVTRGGDMSGDADTGALITVSTTTGIDQSGPHLANSEASFIAIGQYGVRLTFGAGASDTSSSSSGDGSLNLGGRLNKGDRYYVATTAVGQGRVSQIQLSNNIASSLQSEGDLDIEIYSVQDVEITETRFGSPGLYNFETDPNEITVNSGITHFGGDTDVLNGSPIVGGDQFVGYRAQSQDYVNSVQTVSDVSELGSFFDDLTPENPLGFGCKKALENSNGVGVKFIGVATDDLTGYTDAVNKTLEREDVYSFVPLSTDPAIQNMVVGHVNGQSSPEKGRWRIAWVTTPVDTELQVTGSGDTVLATITNDPADAASTYRLVTASNGTFLTDGVLPGDELRYAFTVDSFGQPVYSSGVVDVVISETQVKLLNGPAAPVNVAAKIEIWRNLDNDDQVAALVSANTYGNRRVYNLPDAPAGSGPTMDGFTDVDDVYLACIYAGLRSGVAPHQGLTNVQIVGVEAIPYYVEVLNGADLDILMNAGYWLTVQDPGTGDIFCRKQISTDLTDVKTTEQSITTNVDSISYTFKESLAPYIGRTNNVQSVQNQIRSDIESTIEFFINDVRTPTLGGQLLAATITELRPHVTQPDRLVITLDSDVPFPLNNIDLTLVV